MKITYAVAGRNHSQYWDVLDSGLESKAVALQLAQELKSTHPQYEVEVWREVVCVEVVNRFNAATRRGGKKGQK